jgi:hypothetical protein
MLALQPHTVTVRKRIAPLPVAAKLHVTVADHAASRPDGPCHGTMHRIMTMEGVREARFPWFELQANLLEPLLCLLVECVERVEVTMEEQGVSRCSSKATHLHTPVNTGLPRSPKA